MTTWTPPPSSPPAREITSDSRGATACSAQTPSTSDEISRRAAPLGDLVSCERITAFADDNPTRTSGSGERARSEIPAFAGMKASAPLRGNQRNHRGLDKLDQGSGQRLGFLPAFEWSITPSATSRIDLRRSIAVF